VGGRRRRHPGKEARCAWSGPGRRKQPGYTGPSHPGWSGRMGPTDRSYSRNRAVRLEGGRGRGPSCPSGPAVGCPPPPPRIDRRRSPLPSNNRQARRGPRPQTEPEHPIDQGPRSLRGSSSRHRPRALRRTGPGQVRIGEGRNARCSRWAVRAVGGLERDTPYRSAFGKSGSRTAGAQLNLLLTPFDKSNLDAGRKPGARPEKKKPKPFADNCLSRLVFHPIGGRHARSGSIQG
jgi:hypothetical protein